MEEKQRGQCDGFKVCSSFSHCMAHHTKAPQAESLGRLIGSKIARQATKDPTLTDLNCINSLCQ